ncbi:hypothetical protein BDR05DRAFT_946956 [Suillus weaverae]|nr:hypothetical protein BDR05DRAFT_946956 [Suillus weaverae]
MDRVQIVQNILHRCGEISAFLIVVNFIQGNWFISVEVFFNGKMSSISVDHIKIKVTVGKMSSAGQKVIDTPTILVAPASQLSKVVLTVHHIFLYFLMKHRIVMQQLSTNDSVKKFKRRMFKANVELFLSTSEADCPGSKYSQTFSQELSYLLSAWMTKLVNLQSLLNSCICMKLVSVKTPFMLYIKIHVNHIFTCQLSKCYKLIVIIGKKYVVRIGETIGFQHQKSS